VKHTKLALNYIFISMAIVQLRLPEKQEGVILIEYVLIIALLAMVGIATLTTIGTNISAKFSAIASSVAG